MRLLLVDDNESIRRLLKMALEKEHYDVHSVDNAHCAIKLIEQKKFDWLISDIRMEGMDGIELAKKVRSEYPEIKIILMTAFEVSEKIKDINVEAFLEKPVRIEDICAVLQSN